MALELLTMKEAAALLRVDRTTLLRWQKHKALPEIRVGNRPVYDKQDVVAYLEYLEKHGRPKPGRKKAAESTDAVAA